MTIEQALGILFLQPLNLLRGTQVLGNLPGVEDGFNKVGPTIKTFADRGQGLDLGGERVGFFPEVVPLARCLGIRKVAHHFHQVGPEPGMEVQIVLASACVTVAS